MYSQRILARSFNLSLKVARDDSFFFRPFGTKGGINFDDVQKYLITPALAGVDVQGSTTEPFLQAGNIRADMFQQLLVADIVVADGSIHHATCSI